MTIWRDKDQHAAGLLKEFYWIYAGIVWIKLVIFDGYVWTDHEWWQWLLHLAWSLAKSCVWPITLLLQ